MRFVRFLKFVDFKGEKVNVGEMVSVLVVVRISVFIVIFL